MAVSSGVRRWASMSLPRLIMFGIGLHLFFSAMMANQLNRLQNFRMRAKMHFVTQDEFFFQEGFFGATLQARRRRLHRKTHNLQLSSYTQYDGQDHSEGGHVTDDLVKEEVDDLYIEHLRNISEQIQQTLPNVTQIMSCRWRHNSNDIYAKEDCGFHMANKRSHDTHSSSLARVVLFNPVEQERILCDGSRIGPASIKVLPEGDLSCSEPPRLFATPPSFETIQDMKPVELRFRVGGRRDKLLNFPCDVPCLSDDRPGVVTKRYVKSTPFAIEFSMEGPQYYNVLRVNPKAHKRNQYYSTTSFQSEIPLPYFSWSEYGDKIQGTAVKYDEAIKGAVFIARNCNSRNNREGLVRALIESDFRVDSVSKCLHNAEAPDGLSDKIDIMGRYLFYLAFENQCEEDYITEKLWGTLKAGTVPVYYGAPNIEDHVPPHSVINANAFDTSEDLAEYLHEVANDREKYEAYHEWRNKPLPEAFVRKYNFTHVHSTCRTCRWAFAKKYGLGWDHEKQTVEDLIIERKMCHDAHGLLTHPFQETWLSGSGQDVLLISRGRQSRHKACHVKGTSFKSTIRVGNHTLNRRVSSQDGVTDIFLDSGNHLLPKSDGIILRMESDVLSDAGLDGLKVFSQRHYRFQDEQKRMTILTSKDTATKVTDLGVLELYIPYIGTGIQIRTIVENLDSFYEDGKERTNYFGQMMTEEMLNPLEKFVVWGNPYNESSWLVEKEELTNLGIISAADDDAEGNGDDEILQEEEFLKEKRKEEADSLRHSMALTKKTEKKAEEDKKALAGIKKLIAAGIIKVNQDNSDNEDDQDRAHRKDDGPIKRLTAESLAESRPNSSTRREML